jgi:hypothetical protein
MADTTRDLGKRIAAVRASGLFDDAEYEFRDEAAARLQDPVHHYLTGGEARGARPSRHFNPHYYAVKHGIKGDSPLIHYLLFGRKMGLGCVPVSSEFTFAENSFRAGFDRIVLLAPDPDDGEASDMAIRLVQGLQTSVDVIVVYLDGLPVQPAFGKEAACIAGPSRQLEAGWDANLTEAAYLIAEIVERYQPASVICSSSRTRRLVPRFAAKSIPTVALICEDASERERFRYDLYRSSAVIVFASESTRTGHAACYPWIASRRTVVAPLLSSQPDNVEATTQGLLSAMRDAQFLFAELTAKHERIMNSPRILEFLTSEGIGAQQMKTRIRQNCMVGGLATGGAPAFPIPRLMTGFDSRRYAAERQLTGGNPVIDYLLEERFDTFRRPVIRPQTSAVQAHGSCRAALHGHYYYTDVAEELLLALRVNRHPIDLYLSTDTEAKAQELSAMLARHAMKAEIRIFPNKGRDIGPLLTGFRDLFDAGYDVIGHVHGKKSANRNGDFGERWRRYLLQLAVGGKHCMADTILSAFAQNESLGLVFPEDELVIGWERNLEDARRLESRMRIDGGLRSASFDFPAGSFFWCRPSAIKPLLSLELAWSDYPDEPVPFDGTILHAIERLITFVCTESAYQYATVNAADIAR